MTKNNLSTPERGKDWRGGWVRMLEMLGGRYLQEKEEEEVEVEEEVAGASGWIWDGPPQDWWMAAPGVAPCQALTSLYSVNR